MLRRYSGAGNDLERLPRALIMGASPLPGGQHSQTQTVSDDHGPGPVTALARVSPPLPGPFFARQALCQGPPPPLELRFRYQPASTIPRQIVATAPSPTR